MLKALPRIPTALLLLSLALPAFSAPAAALQATPQLAQASENIVPAREVRERRYFLFPFFGYEKRRIEPDTVYVYPPVPPAEAEIAWVDHVDWCEDHYATYDEETDTYQGSDGFRHRCVEYY